MELEDVGSDDQERPFHGFYVGQLGQSMTMDALAVDGITDN